MKESQRIIKLFEDLYNGNPWIDVNIKSVLEQVTAEQAARQILPGRNSIWQIVNHITGWHLNVLQRVRGKTVTSPDDNYITSITDTSEAAWKKSLEQLEDSHRQWLDFLRSMPDAEFEKIYPGNNMTYYEHINGVLQHDAYHLGQIVLLSKLL